MTAESVTWDLIARDRASTTLNRVAGATNHLHERAVAAAKGLALVGSGAALAGLMQALRTGFSEVTDYEKGFAQLRAGLKSTHDVAGVTAKGMENLASRIEAYSGQTDDSIVATEQLLLTFTNIQDQAGKNNDIFDQTVKIAADMAARLGGDASSAAIQLGKALNDPAKGLTALTRVGVSFSDQQRKVIMQAVEHGHVLRAQKIEVHELNREFGGSARLYGQTLPGQIDRTKRAWEGVSQQLVRKLTPDLLDLARFTRRDLMPALEDFGGWARDHKTELEWFAGVLAGAAVSVKALKGINAVRGVLRGPASGGVAGALGGSLSPIPVYVVNRPGLSNSPGGSTPTGSAGFGSGLFRSAAAVLGLANVVSNQMKLPAGTSFKDRALNAAGSGMVFGTAGGELQGTNKILPPVREQDIKPLTDAQKQLKATGIAGLSFVKSLKDQREEAQRDAKQLTALNQLLIVNPGLAATAGKAHDRLALSMRSAVAQAKIEAATLGNDLGRGLIAGIEAEIPHATTAGKVLVSQTVKSMRFAAEAHSPSRATFRLGDDLGQGLINGWYDSKVYEHLSRDVQNTLGRLSDLTNRARFDRRDEKQSLISTFSQIDMTPGTDSLGASGPPKSILSQLKQDAHQAETFTRLYLRLAHKHLSPQLLEMFQALGPEAIPTMRQWLSHPATAIRQANRAEHRINQAAGGIAVSDTDDRYGKPVVRAIEKLPHRLASEMRRELKHLKIHTSLKEIDRAMAHKVRSS